MLATRSFGGVLVERTFYCRGQTGQQLLLGAYQALQKQVADGQAKVHTRHEMLDLVVVDGEARGIVARDLVTGEIEAHAGRRRRPRHRRLLQRLLPLDEREGLQRDRDLARPQARRRLRQPLLHPDPPDLHPAVRRLPVEAHPDERVAAQRRPDLGAAGRRRGAPARGHPRRGPLLLPRGALSRASATSFPATSPHGRRRSSATRDSGSARTGRGVYLDFRDAIEEKGAETIAGRYGNLFEMYERITGDSPWETPMKIYPAPHYSMGGLWVDYTLQTTIPGLFAIGEANFSDHGANRLGASAMMQCLADGYFILPHTVTDYLARHRGAARPRPRGLRGDGREVRRPPRRAPGRRRQHRGDGLPPPARPGDARPLRDHPRRGGAALGDRARSARSATTSGATCASTAPARG